MRIAIFSHRFYPLAPVGGVQLQAYEIALGLKRRGHEVTVYTSGGNSGSKALSVDGIAVFAYPRLRGPLQRVVRCPHDVAPRMLDAVMRIHGSGTDVVQAFGSGVSFQTLVASLGTRIRRLPFAYSPGGIHLPPPLTLESPGRIWEQIYRRSVGRTILRSADIILTLTETGKRLIQSLGIPGSKIRVIPRGIHLEFFRELPPSDAFRSSLDLGSDDRLILSVGSPGVHKGTHTLISAFGKIAGSRPTVKLALVGPDTRVAQSMVDRLLPPEVRDRVLIVGPLRDRALGAAYAAADVFVLASFSEGFGVVVLEAAAAGLPVIATRTGVAAELVRDGANGMFVRYGDDVGLAVALDTILSSDAFRRDARRLRGSVMERYGFEREIAAYSDVYHELAEAHAG